MIFMNEKVFEDVVEARKLETHSAVSLGFGQGVSQLHKITSFGRGFSLG